MPFEIPIKVDTTQPVQGLAELNKAIGLAETGGEKAGQAVSKGFRDSAASVGQAKQGVTSLADEIKRLQSDPIGALNAEWARQKQLLDAIRGPQIEYERNMNSLLQMVTRGTISWSEYGDAVGKANAQLGRTNPSAVPQAPTSGGGGGGGMFDALGGAGGPLGSMTAMLTNPVTAAVALGGALVKLSDDYLGLTNQVERFAASHEGAQAIVSAQLDMAGQLHSSLSDTMALYLRVKEGADGLNLTYQQTNALERSLAESVRLSGGGMEQAASVMQKLTYAMDSGAVSGRELRSTMREVPELGTAWAQYFDTTEAGLVAMANAGEISGRQLVDATIASSQRFDDEWSKHIESVGEKWTHFKDQVTQLAGKAFEFNPLSDSHAMSVVMDTNPLTKLLFGGGGNDASAKQAEGAKKWEDALNGVSAAYSNIIPNSKYAADNAKLLGDALAALMSYQGDFAKYADDASLWAKNMDAAKSAVAAFDIELGTVFHPVMDQLTHLLDSQAKAHEANIGKLSDEEKMLQDILRPQKEYASGIASIDDLMKKGLITADQWIAKFNELQKLQGAGAGVTMSGLNTFAGHAQTASLGSDDHLADTKGMSAIGTAIAQLKEVTQLPPAFTQTEDALEKMKKSLAGLESPAEKFAARLAEIRNVAAQLQPGDADGLRAVTQAMIDADQKVLGKDFTSTAESTYNAQMAALQDLNSHVVLSSDQVASAVDKIKIQFLEAQGAALTFGQSIELDMLKAKSAAQSAAEAIKKEFGDALRGVNDELTKLLMGEKTDFGSMAKGLAKSAISSTLSTAEGGLLDAIKMHTGIDLGAASKGAAAAAGGKAAQYGSATFASAVFQHVDMPGVGGGGGGSGDPSTFASSATIGIAGMLGLSGPGAGLVNSLLGGAIKGAFATGGAFDVGGVGGTDTQLVAFRATPGERVSVQTPAQQQAADRAPAPAPVLHNHNHIHLDPNELMSAIESHPRFEQHVTSIATRAVGPMVGLRSRNG